MVLILPAAPGLLDLDGFQIGRVLENFFFFILNLLDCSGSSLTGKATSGVQEALTWEELVLLPCFLEDGHNGLSSTSLQKQVVFFPPKEHLHLQKVRTYLMLLIYWFNSISRKGIHF